MAIDSLSSTALLGSVSKLTHLLAFREKPPSHSSCQKNTIVISKVAMVGIIAWGSYYLSTLSKDYANENSSLSIALSLGYSISSISLFSHATFKMIESDFAPDDDLKATIAKKALSPCCLRATKIGSFFLAILLESGLAYATWVGNGKTTLLSPCVIMLASVPFSAFSTRVSALKFPKKCSQFLRYAKECCSFRSSVTKRDKITSFFRSNYLLFLKLPFKEQKRFVRRLKHLSESGDVTGFYEKLLSLYSKADTSCRDLVCVKDCVGITSTMLALSQQVVMAKLAMDAAEAIDLPEWASVIVGCVFLISKVPLNVFDVQKALTGLLGTIASCSSRGTYDTAEGATYPLLFTTLMLLCLLFATLSYGGSVEFSRQAFGEILSETELSALGVGISSSFALFSYTSLERHAKTTTATLIANRENEEVNEVFAFAKRWEETIKTMASASDESIDHFIHDLPYSIRSLTGLLPPPRRIYRSSALVK